MVEYESENADDAKIIKYAAITIEVMQEFKLRLQQEKVHKLETNITRCFNYLAQKERMVSSVEINPDTLNITLRDYAGGELLKVNYLLAKSKCLLFQYCGTCVKLRLSTSCCN